MVLGVIGAVYGATAALTQRDFKLISGYSSVSHMGYVLMGLATIEPDRRHWRRAADVQPRRHDGSRLPPDRRPLRPGAHPRPQGLRRHRDGHAHLGHLLRDRGPRERWPAGPFRASPPNSTSSSAPSRPTRSSAGSRSSPRPSPPPTCCACSPSSSSGRSTRAGASSATSTPLEAMSGALLIGVDRPHGRLVGAVHRPHRARRSCSFRG